MKKKKERKKRKKKTWRICSKEFVVVSKLVQSFLKCYISKYDLHKLTNKKSIVNQKKLAK